MTPRNHLPSHLITSRAHWEAMADALGEEEATKLYGPAPELVGSADHWHRLYQPVFADKAPGRALIVVICLALVLACSVAYRATHRATRAEVIIDPCALVQTRDGSECR